jgi:deoxycytidine triphosphate deaminase
MRYPPFATSPEEAIHRAKKFRDDDPFPEIKPTLLNSADITDYVIRTGMLDPFYNNPDKLKSASYEVDFLGVVGRWEPERGWVCESIARGEEFELRSNSIAFVQVEPYFRLPNYIAVRFNLRIKHVYRGLLLGTGPLVDPGFWGRLYIPLHNLTSNNYVLVGGDGLLWMEFTKLNWPPPEYPGAVETALTRTGRFFGFPQSKSEKDLNYYLRKADENRRIKSSIPDEAIKARKSAQKAETTIKQIRNWGLAAAGVAIVTFIIGFGQIILDAFSLSDSVEQRIQSRVDTLEQEVRVLQGARGTPTNTNERLELRTPTKRVDQ